MEVVNGLDVVFGESESVNVSLVTGTTVPNFTEGWYVEMPPGVPRRLSDTQRLLVTMVILLLILFITLGNLATIIAVCVYKRLRSVSNLYLASLATADLFVGLPVMTFMLLYTVTLNGHWIFGDVICDVWTYLDYVSCTTSLTNVCAIAGDRFMTLAQPLKSIRKRTKKRLLKIILCVWLVPMAVWLGVIIALRVTNGHPPTGTCYLIWKPDLLLIASVVGIVYVPLATILILFISILCLLKHHMDSLNQHLNRCSPMQKEPLPDDHVTAEVAGGISFNPRCVKPNAKQQTRNIPLETLRRRGRAGLDSGGLVSKAAGPDATSDIMCSDVELYFLKGRKFRTVGTSTSPERLGLVRTVGTNTSPSLHRKDVGCGSASVGTSVPDVASVGRSATDVTSLLTGSAATSVGVATDVRSDESDTDTVKTFSTCSGSSTSRSSRTNDSDLSLVRLRTKLRRHYATLLRSEREGWLERTRLKQQIRAARILGTIMGFLLVCWLPFSILWPLRTFCPGCVSQAMFEASIWTNYVNSAINPVIYCLYNPSFRRAFRRLFCSHCPCRFICRDRHN